MKNKDIEKRLIQLQDEDPHNPEIYDLVVEMTGNMIMSQKWNLSPADFDNVVHDVAADVFMKVNNGYYIRIWKAFIYRTMKYCYIPRQRKLSFPQVIDTRMDPLARENVVSSFISNSFDFSRSINIIENKMLFESIPQLIKDVLKESKYYEDKEILLPISISVSLSLYHAKTIYFHLPDYLKPFVNICVAEVKNKLVGAGITCDSITSEVANNSLYNSELYRVDTEE